MMRYTSFPGNVIHAFWIIAKEKYANLYPRDTSVRPVHARVDAPCIQQRRYKTICRSPQLIAVLNRGGKKSRRRRGKSKERDLAGSKERLGDDVRELAE